jgi:hypothetical protein
MINAEVTTLLAPDGTPVANVAFDVSNDQLRAAEHALGEIKLERHRGRDLDIDDVLALRELTGVRDELDHLAAAGGHAHVLLPLARFIVLHDALHEWVAGRQERGWVRPESEKALAIAAAMLGPMDTLRADALAAVLGTQSETETL